MLFGFILLIKSSKDLEEYQRIDDEINRDPDTMDADEVINASVYGNKDKELNYKIIETKNSNKEILVSFMKLFIKYIKNTQFTYNKFCIINGPIFLVFLKTFFLYA